MNQDSDEDQPTKPAATYGDSGISAEGDPANKAPIDSRRPYGYRRLMAPKPGGSFGHGFLAWFLCLLFGGFLVMPLIWTFISRSVLGWRLPDLLFSVLYSLGFAMTPFVVIGIFSFRRRKEPESIKWLLILWGVTFLLSTLCGMAFVDYF